MCSHECRRPRPLDEGCDTPLASGPRMSAIIVLNSRSMLVASATMDGLLSVDKPDIAS